MTQSTVLLPFKLLTRAVSAEDRCVESRRAKTVERRLRNWRATVRSTILTLAAFPCFAVFACDSGPDFCTDDPRIPGALAAKKQNLTNQGYPARLVGLLDIGIQCVARIEREPDGFRLIDVQDDSQKTEINWSDDEEAVAKANLISGKSQRYWIVNSRRAFQCDGQLPYNQQSDYDAIDDLNTDAAIKCVLVNGVVSCNK